MRITVRDIRRWIVGLACLLVAVLVGFLFYARLQLRHVVKDLPGKLGANIQRTANGYTYSQSDKGHTLFTIHASRLVQFKKGHATLHDVAITLYGPQGSGRTDKIYGSDFDYDQHNGIASAKGEVRIDLTGPGTSNPAQPQKNAIHVKTSGLVFNQKTGEAMTADLVQFAFPAATGNAVGASYNSKTGELVLNSKVEFTTQANGKPVVVHAVHAEMQRDTRQSYLIHPEVESQGERSTALQSVVYFRPDGSAEKIDAKGDVHVTTSGGAQVNSQMANVLLDSRSQPQRVDLGGGVTFLSHQKGQQMNGVANGGTLLFGANSMLKHAQFRNTVSFVEQVTGLPGDPRGTATRQVRASQMDVDFAPGPGGKSVAQKLLATGKAVVVLRTVPSNIGHQGLSHGVKAGEQSTTIRGDQLLATLAHGSSVRQVDGSGHTQIMERAQDGSTSTSSGDTLHLTFTSAPARGATKDRERAQIATAIQTGHVALIEMPAQKPGKPVPPPLHATAQRAEYDAKGQILHLTGAPRVNDGPLDLTAQAIEYHRDTGNANARGDVKATYEEKQGQDAPSFGTQGPVHLVAAEAQLNQTTGDSIFTGSAQSPARMWQSGDAVAAPVIELSKKQQTIQAHGEANTGGRAVDTTLTSAMGPKHQPSVIRIQSQTLFYSDKDRRGDFRGAVEAQSSAGIIRSDAAQVFLIPAAESVNPGLQKRDLGHPQSPSQSRIERIVATGHVVLSQPGRKGTGEKLVYRAKDGRYVLTGTAAHPPRIEDAAKGTTTGAALIFNSQDDSVVVSGGQSSAVTETRAPK